MLEAVHDLLDVVHPEAVEQPPLLAQFHLQQGGGLAPEQLEAAGEGGKVHHRGGQLQQPPVRAQ